MYRKMQKERGTVTDIPQFYKGKSVFITGGTGFLGKVLVERLLTTCPDIGKLFLLVREKKGVAPEKRLDDLKQSPVFDVLRENNPQQLDKIVALSGDLTQKCLGLIEEDCTQLNEVSIVFHSAGSVKLNEPLANSVNHNIRPVIEILKFCDDLPNIEAFVHVSTIYTNAEYLKVEEKVYPSSINLDTLLPFVEHHNLTDEITKKLIAPKPITYLFTKAVAENIVENHGYTHFSVAIVRPAVVVSSLKYPFPGWVDGLNGPSGVIAGSSTGFLKFCIANDSARADVVPVDINADTLIAVAWQIAVDKLEKVRVYNCSAGDNAITWGYFTKKVNENISNYPSNRGVFYPYYRVIANRQLYLIVVTLFQTIPVYMVEYFSRLFFQKRRQNFIEVNKKTLAMVDTLRWFSCNGWNFANDNIVKLQQRLSKKDRVLFNLDTNTIDWNEHLSNFVKGNRKYVLRESEDTLDSAKSRIRKLDFIDKAVKGICVLVILKILVKYVFMGILKF